jgi:hypothetical protein
MDDFFNELTQTTGLGRETAERAVAIILGFLKKAGPPDRVAELMEKLPLADKIEIDESSAMGGMMGAMAAFNSLTSAGLDMGQIQGVTRHLVAYAKQQAGDELVDEVIGSIPGLGQFV